MVRIIYGVIILIIGFAVSFSGICRVKLSESFADRNRDCTEKQHKLIGIVLIVVGVIAIVAGATLAIANFDTVEEEQKQTYCNICGGDLLCDVCGADAPYCATQIEGYNTSAAHYCEEHRDGR